MAPDIPNTKLRDGTIMPVMGFGTGTAWYKEDPSGPFERELVDMVKQAISEGYRHIDCAEMYGTERELGVAIKECGVPREELYITTKVLESIDNIQKAIDSSLEKLQLEYVDMYIIHSPYFAKGNAELQAAWKEMEKVQRSSKAKSIGVSSFLRPHVEAVLEIAEIPPAVNQIEFHPYLQRAGDYVPWLQQQNITVQSFFGLAPITHAKGGPLDETLAAIAKKYEVAESAVLMRWHLDQDVVSISTTRKKSRIQEYFQALALQLTKEEKETISRIGATHHVRLRLSDEFDPDDRS